MQRMEAAYLRFRTQVIVVGVPKQITFITLSTAQGISPNKGWESNKTQEGFEMQLSRFYTTMQTVALNHS